MAKITGPLLSLSASGTIANALNYGTTKKCDMVRRARKNWHPIVIGTPARVAVRVFFARSVAVGRNLDGASKAIFDSAAKSYSITGFNLFLQDFYNERPATLGANELGKLRFGGLTRLQ